MLCTPLKNFPFSRDGVNAEAAVIGVDCDIPDALVAGLLAAGYLTEAKAISTAPENKMLTGAGENKGELRHDGPTIAQFVEAGYPAVNYPPHGYASRSTPDEIADAIAAQPAAAGAIASQPSDGGSQNASAPSETAAETKTEAVKVHANEAKTKGKK